MYISVYTYVFEASITTKIIVEENAQVCFQIFRLFTCL